MRNYDLCLAWNWEYDADFVKLLDQACQSHGLSLLQITPENLSDTMRSLANKEIIFQSYDEHPLLPAIDLASLGDGFTIKPALGGGGDGVITEATSLSQVLVARPQFPSQGYLLQARIIPARLLPRMAWFRVTYCVGKVYPCWGDNLPHIYA